MIDSLSYKERQPPPWGTVSESERLQTAAYIRAEWEREHPGMMKEDDPAAIQAGILAFMEESIIQTIEDYEQFTVKL